MKSLPNIKRRNLGNSIPVRFDPDTIRKLDEIAERTGLSRVALVRRGTGMVIEEVESTGKIAVPA